MELRHLKYVVAVARNGSFSAASHELAVQQPIVSRRVRELEAEIGSELFERTTAGARLTPSGKEFVALAEHILDNVQNLVERLQSSREGQFGQISVGFYKSLSSGEFRAFVRRFRQEHPDIHLDLREMPFRDLIAGLHSDRLDAAIILGDAGKIAGLESMALWAEHLVVALPEGHPLADRPIIYWPELKGERFLISRYDPGPDIRSMLVANLAAPSDQPDIRDLYLSRESILSQVADGQGITLQCESATGITGLSLTYRQVHTSSGATRLGYIICWNADTRNPALKTLLEALRP